MFGTNAGATVTYGRAIYELRRLMDEWDGTNNEQYAKIDALHTAITILFDVSWGDVLCDAVRDWR